MLAWGTGPVMPVPDKCIHELFEEQAAAHPDAVALVLGDDEMTYGELDRRSTLLAAPPSSLRALRYSVPDLAVSIVQPEPPAQQMLGLTPGTIVQL